MMRENGFVVAVDHLLPPVPTERKPVSDRWGIEAKASWSKEKAKYLNYSREPKNLRGPWSAFPERYLLRFCQVTISNFF